MIKKHKYFYVRILIVSLLLLIILKPVFAQDNSTELDSINWLGIVEVIMQFFADVLENSADVVRRGVDVFNEMFG